MKRVLVVLFLMLLAVRFPVEASGQSSVTHGQSLQGSGQAGMVGGTNGGNGYIFQTDASGNLYAIPLVATTLLPAISVSNMTTAAESSAVLDVANYAYLKLLIKGVTRGNTAGSRIAIQLRECANGLADSTSLFATYLYGASNQGGALSLVDSLRTGHLATGSVTAAWSGEYIVDLTANRNAPGNAVAAVPYHYPNGIDLPLDWIFGRQVRYDKLQIRVRNLNQAFGVDLTIQVKGFTR